VKVEHCAECIKCGAKLKERCTSNSGRKTTPHKVRRNDAGRFVAQAYCAGEYYSTGYGCGTDGCPHCG